MATNADLLASIAALDVATNAVAAELTELRETIKVDMSPAEVEAAKALIDAQTARLTTLAADPADPVPEEPTV